MQNDLLLSLRKFLTPEIVYGNGAIRLAGTHALNMGASKVMVVSDTGVMSNGWTARVQESLSAAGLPFYTFTDNSPNPKDYEVMNGAEIYLKEKCDLIIAVGGGSPMDCAKGIGVVATNDGIINDFEGVDEIPHPGPPLIFIPTTAGTSADISQFAIISDSTRDIKFAIVSKMVIPDIALVDPETTVTMPPDLTAATGMDALCHAVEAFVSTASSPLTDMAARNAVDLVFKNLVGAFSEPNNTEYRDNMMMASLMAGLAFSNASLGLVHAMAHSLGGTFDLAHGECNAVLLEKVVRHNYPFASDKYDQLAQPMGLDFAHIKETEHVQAIADAISTLRKKVGLKLRLSDAGIPLSELARLSQYAYNDPCLATNPRDTNPDEIEALFREIY